MRGEEDRVLVERTVDGDEKAFRRIVGKYTGIVYSAVRAVIGNRGDIDDIVQEIFIKVYRGLPGFRGSSRLSTWIYRIARNEALNARARMRTDHLPIEDIREMPGGFERPDAMYARSRVISDIRRLVAGLDEKYREVIELRYMAERSYVEIAEIMDIPVGTVKTYIHRARARLREMIDRPGAGHGEDGPRDGM